LDLIVNQVNFTLREKALKESHRAIQFLTTEISSSNSVEVRNSIAFLIQDNLENQVKAKVKEDFIVSEIEPPYVPVIKSKPNRTLIVIFGTFIGFLIGSIVILLRFFYSGSSKK
jgi:LPS O-antigen subunit length determinant protein (WzzB/FepE family)